MCADMDSVTIHRLSPLRPIGPVIKDIKEGDRVGAPVKETL